MTDDQDARVADTQAVLSDLTRVKALFQLRTIAAVIGAPIPQGIQTSKEEK